MYCLPSSEKQEFNCEFFYKILSANYLYLCIFLNNIVFKLV